MEFKESEITERIFLGQNKVYWPDFCNMLMNLRAL